MQPLGGLFIKGQSLLGKEMPPTITRELLRVMGLPATWGSRELQQTVPSACWDKNLMIHHTGDGRHGVSRPPALSFPFGTLGGLGMGPTENREGLLLSTPTHLTHPTGMPRGLLPDPPTPNKDTYWGGAGQGGTTQTPAFHRDPDGGEETPTCLPGAPLPVLHPPRTQGGLIHPRAPLGCTLFSSSCGRWSRPAGDQSSSCRSRSPTGVTLPTPLCHTSKNLSKGSLHLTKVLCFSKAPSTLVRPWFWSQGPCDTKVLRV